MKRINAQQMNVGSLYSPLSEMVELTAVGGRSLEQWHYVNEGVYYPNRRSSALTLRPVIRVADPDTSRTYTPTITGSLWYYRRHGETSWTQVTNTTESADEPFTVKSNNDLVVRANYTVELLCEIIYADPRNSMSVNTSAQTTLVTNEDAESVYNVHIYTGAGGYEYSPLTEDSSLKTFKAMATLGFKDVTDDVIFQWFTLPDGMAVPAGSVDGLVPIDTNDPAYVSGQGTKTLVLDAMYADSYPIILRMKRSASAPGLEPCRDRAHMVWRIPAIKGEVYSPQGNAVKGDSAGDMTFKPIYTTNLGTVSDDKVKDHLIIDWSRRSSAGSFSKVGTGPSIKQKVKDIRTNGTTSTLMQAEAYLRGPYRQVVQDGNNVIIEIDGVTYNVVERE